jgi:hypothetical protein
MIEFMLKDRRMRLINDVFYSRAVRDGKETKKEIWRKVLFFETAAGYLTCNLTLNKVDHMLLQHRLVWYAHHQDWNIWDRSTNNFIDHKNKIRNDNRLCNLHVVTHSENQQNRDCNGCYFHKQSNKWKAQIMINGKLKYIGAYDTYEEAHEEYLKAKRELHPYFVEEEEL